MYICRPLHAQSCPILCDSRTVAHHAPRPRDSPGKNTRAGCHFLLQEVFLSQASNRGLLCLLHWQEVSLPLSHPGSPSPPFWTSYHPTPQSCLSGSSQNTMFIFSIMIFFSLSTLYKICTEVNIERETCR